MSYARRHSTNVCPGNRVRYIQIGGVSGRHEPDDTEEINCPYLFDLIDDLGFDGWVGCEYRPSVGTVEGLAWARPYGIGG